MHYNEHVILRVKHVHPIMMWPLTSTMATMVSLNSFRNSLNIQTPQSNQVADLKKRRDMDEKGLRKI